MAPSARDVGQGWLELGQPKIKKLGSGLRDHLPCPLRERARESSPSSRRRYTADAVHNIYFELTEAFNAHGPTVALASGQAVVFYRIAIMSKDGDWVIRETPQACERVLAELERRSAYYRPGAPLDVRWLGRPYAEPSPETGARSSWRSPKRPTNCNNRTAVDSRGTSKRHNRI